ncbi:MAG: DUF502 domain-containing protein [Halobacteria archaeon]|nr:DUF502 domain-containing protein [Halobacteria archaeon]
MDLRLRRDLASGLVILAPVAVTAYIAYWLFDKIASLPGAKFFGITPYASVNQFVRVVVSVFVIVVLLGVVGRLVRTAMGVVVERQVDRLANSIPGLRMVYNATKMGVETAIGGADEFQKPVKVEFEGARLTAFKTGNTTDDGREILFLPTAPNITTGFVIELEPERIEETDESVEDALTRTLSAGFGDANKDKDKRG